MLTSTHPITVKQLRRRLKKEWDDYPVVPFMEFQEGTWSLLIQRPYDKALVIPLEEIDNES